MQDTWHYAGLNAAEEDSRVNEMLRSNLNSSASIIATKELNAH